MLSQKGSMLTIARLYILCLLEVWTLMVMPSVIWLSLRAGAETDSVMITASAEKENPV